VQDDDSARYGPRGWNDPRPRRNREHRKERFWQGGCQLTSPGCGIEAGRLSGCLGRFEDHDFLTTACRALEHKLVLPATLWLDQRQPHSRFALWTGSVQQRIVPPRHQLAVLQLTLPSTPSPTSRRTVDTDESELESWPARVSITRRNYQQENSMGHSEKF